MLKRINNEKVELVPQMGGSDKRPIKGNALFPELYSNIFLCARKNSGKTSLIYTILKKCSGRDTKILAFVSTLFKDPAWLGIQEWAKKKGVYFEGHTSLSDEDNSDILDLFVKSEQIPEEVEQEENKTAIVIKDDETEDPEKEKKEKKEKYVAPEWIIILDDLSDEIKSRSLVALLKKNRHLKAKVIVSSQYFNDLLPSARKQIDTFIIFGGEPEAKLKEIYRSASVSIPFQQFQEWYHHATKDKYNFFYVDTRKDKFRQNFNLEF